MHLSFETLCLGLILPWLMFLRADNDQSCRVSDPCPRLIAAEVTVAGQAKLEVNCAKKLPFCCLYKGSPCLLLRINIRNDLAPRLASNMLAKGLFVIMVFIIASFPQPMSAFPCDPHPGRVPILCVHV
uniref:Hydrophobin n=1 Tax=Bionectria ochroleuca TaxID=29856 RepID=A0A0B7JN92_BIOOC